MSRTIAFLDSCVLFPFSVRDVLLEFAYREMFQAKWSRRVETETIRNVEHRFPKTKGKLSSTFRLMERVVPNFSAEPSASSILEVQSPKTDSKDIEILAAAIANNCSHLVTFNLKDFDIAYAMGRSVKVIHPDEFVAKLIDQNQEAASVGLKAILKRCKNPPRTESDYASAMRKNHRPKTAETLLAL